MGDVTVTMNYLLHIILQLWYRTVPDQSLLHSNQPELLTYTNLSSIQVSRTGKKLEGNVLVWYIITLVHCCLIRTLTDEHHHEVTIGPNYFFRQFLIITLYGKAWYYGIYIIVSTHWTAPLLHVLSDSSQCHNSHHSIVAVQVWTCGIVYPL